MTILITVFFISHYLLGINPFSIDLYITRIMSILLFIIISYYNSIESFYLLCLLPPFSLDKIHFVHDLEVKSLNIYQEIKSMLLLKNLTRDLTIFLENLNEKDNY
jgi:hypothetical protein